MCLKGVGIVRYINPLLCHLYLWLTTKDSIFIVLKLRVMEDSNRVRTELKCDDDTLEFVEDLFITAVESGYSGMWGYINSEDTFEKLVRCEIPEIKVYDQEGDELLGSITLKDVCNTKEILEENGETFTIDDYDAISADVWLQLVTMGEVRFG